MASYTTNLNLKKPAGSENVAIGDINNNMDIIDNAYGTLNSNITSQFGKLHNYKQNSANSINIELPFTPSSSYIANGILYNANQQILALIRIDNSPSITKIYASLSLSISVTGNTVTITPSATLWGLTNVLLDWNY